MDELDKNTGLERPERKTRPTPDPVSNRKFEIVDGSVAKELRAPDGRESEKEPLDDLTDETRKAFAPPKPDDSAGQIPQLAEQLFKFRTGTKESLQTSTWAATPSFKDGLKAISDAALMSNTEVMRRAVFAIACNPGLLRDPQVEELERRYARLLGAGGGRMHNRRPDEPD